MKYYVIDDEWYPVLTIHTEFSYDWVVELSEAEKQRVDAAFKEFQAVQSLLTQRRQLEKI